MSFQITSYSTALFSTWTFVEELGLLVDAGDGVSAALLQKARKIKHAFITHPDRDHLTGLLQLLQLNSWHGYPKIYYPKDTGSFPAFEAFHRKFNPHVRATDWYGIEDGSAVEIKPNIWVEAQRNEHIAVPQGVNKSLSYKVFTSKRKLKPEFSGLSNAELQRLAIKEGREALTEEFRRNVISFSGDTPVDDYDKWDQSEILIHEATFLQEEPARSNKTYNQHSLLEEVIQMVSEIEVGKLILNHFSSRYKKEEIDTAVQKFCKKYRLQIPVYLIYPGEIHRDVLGQEPVNA